MAKIQQYYNSLPEAALLWCGVKHSDLAEERKFLTLISQSIYKHPYIPCLEKKREF